MIYISGELIVNACGNRCTQMKRTYVASENMNNSNEEYVKQIESVGGVSNRTLIQRRTGSARSSPLYTGRPFSYEIEFYMQLDRGGQSCLNPNQI